METSPYYNGENSDFEDDVVEVDFEEQFEEENKKVILDEEGVFGITPKDVEYPDGLTAEEVTPEDPDDETPIPL